jgi:hypothetical protein
METSLFKHINKGMYILSTGCDFCGIKKRGGGQNRLHKKKHFIYPTVTSARSCNKHNDQEKKDISKKNLFYLHGIYSIQISLF